jgi:hypothetical protein
MIHSKPPTNESPCIILIHELGQNTMLNIMLYSPRSLIWITDNVFQRSVISYKSFDVTVCGRYRERADQTDTFDVFGYNHNISKAGSVSIIR